MHTILTILLAIIGIVLLVALILGLFAGQAYVIMFVANYFSPKLLTYPAALGITMIFNLILDAIRGRTVIQSK
jgi:hypothetical protein